MHLSNETLGAFGSEIQVPKYDRSEISTGIIHLGPSHFSRAHLFKYIDDILGTDPRWGVTAISLRTAEARDALQGQDYLYSLTEKSSQEKSSQESRTRIIGSLQKIIVAPEEPQEALNAFLNPDVKLVTLTVTQAGYYYDPSTQLLDFEHEDIKKCMCPSDEPNTAVGYLVAAMEKRKELGLPPLTIMSCDNLPGNGTILRNVVLSYAAAKSRDLREYIEDNVSFPSNMVDRIVPSTTLEEKRLSSAAGGVEEAWPVYTEPFCQFVIEDNFAGDVPNFPGVGALVRENVSPFELMKIRMLNGGHMALGYVGKLAGYEYAHEAMQDENIARFINDFMTETKETLLPVEGVNLEEYQATLIERISEPEMKDELVRLPRDATTGKLERRIIEPLEDAIGHGKDYTHLAFTVAAAVQYLKGIDDAGNVFDIDDKKAVENGLQQIARNSNGNPIPVMAASGLFGKLLEKPFFVEKVTRHLHDIQEHGIIGAMALMQKPEKAALRLVAGGPPKFVPS